MTDIAMRRAFDESRYMNLPNSARAFRTVAQSSTTTQNAATAPQKPVSRSIAFAPPAPRPRTPDDPMPFMWAMSGMSSDDY